MCQHRDRKPQHRRRRTASRLLELGEQFLGYVEPARSPATTVGRINAPAMQVATLPVPRRSNATLLRRSRPSLIRLDPRVVLREGWLVVDDDALDLEARNDVIRRIPLLGRMGIRIVQRKPTTILTMELSDEVRGHALGTVHGGMLATYADVSCGSALEGLFDPQSEVPATTELHVRYFRQPRTGPLMCETTVAHRGRRILSTGCSITDGQGRLLARASATYAIVSGTPLA